MNKLKFASDEEISYDKIYEPQNFFAKEPSKSSKKINQSPHLTFVLVHPSYSESPKNM